MKRLLFVEWIPSNTWEVTWKFPGNSPNESLLLKRLTYLTSAESGPPSLPFLTCFEIDTDTNKGDYQYLKFNSLFGFVLEQSAPAALVVHDLAQQFVQEIFTEYTKTRSFPQVVQMVFDYQSKTIDQHLPVSQLLPVGFPNENSLLLLLQRFSIKEEALTVWDALCSGITIWIVRSFPSELFRVGRVLVQYLPSSSSLIPLCLGTQEELASLKDKRFLVVCMGGEENQERFQYEKERDVVVVNVGTWTMISPVKKSFSPLLLDLLSSSETDQAFVTQSRRLFEL